MNYYLGGFGGSNDGALGWVNNYTLFLNLSRIATGPGSPGSSKTFLFLDQREDSINWGNYQVDMTGFPTKQDYSDVQEAAYTYGQDMPAFYHNGACGFSFADGHSEIHRWKESPTFKPITPETPLANSYIPDPRGKDVKFLHDIATRPKTWSGAN